jgi:hypothetical protein
MIAAARVGQGAQQSGRYAHAALCQEPQDARFAATRRFRSPASLVTLRHCRMAIADDIGLPSPGTYTAAAAPVAFRDMQPRRHRKRRRRRRASAGEWIGSGATVTIEAYARGTASTGTPRSTTCPRSVSNRPLATPCRKAEPGADTTDGACSIMLDGRLLFVAGYTSGGAP